MTTTNKQAEDVEIVPYDKSMHAEYAAFAQRSWGVGCYQAKREYVEWLYETDHRATVQRPHDFLIARTKARQVVVGCIHKMRLSWLGPDGSLIDVPALHNWIVDDNFRQGLGLVLLTKALRSDSHAFVPSAAKDLAEIYRKLKCEEVRGAWYQRVLRPVRGAVWLGLHRAVGWTPKLRPWNRQLPVSFRSIRALAQPTTVDLEVLIDALASEARHVGGVAPSWSVETFRWRFFHPIGPKHVLFHLESDPRCFLIVSIAVHRGLVVARLIEACTGDNPRRAKPLIRDAEAFLQSRLGAHVLLGYSAHPQVNAILRALGWKPRHDSQPSFFHHSPKQPPFRHWSFGGGSADFGFEALT